MAIVFAKQDDSYIPTEDISPIFFDEIPLGTYAVSFDLKLGYYVKTIPDFKLPSKLYGFIHGRSERIINTFFDRPNSTGVILSGEKGSGKTLLAKKVSLDLANQGIITLIVDQSYHGSSFNQFIQNIRQPALVIFDEYEKVYNLEEYQNALLTLFDGVYPSKKLFMVTTNERGRMNSYMMNRPGRFFYAFEYKGVEEESIREYLADKLINKIHVEPFVRYASTYEAFNFDMMSALVEEMNRYNESVTEAAKFVNVQQSWTSRHQYQVTKFSLKDGSRDKATYIRHRNDVNDTHGINPYVHDMYIYYDALDDDGEEDTFNVTFSPLDIKGFSEGVNKIMYENEDAIAEIERVEKKSFDISNYF